MDEQLARAQNQPVGTAEEPEAAVIDPVTTFFDALAGAVGVETVFGEPIRVDQQVVIPVAETSIGGGVGFGAYPEGQRQRPRILQALAGGGGGGGATSRPVAVVIVTPEGVKVKPIIDVGKLALNGLASTAALWSGLAAFLGALRRRR